MAARPSIILLEFNELSPLLMERFIAAGKLPTFKHLRDRSATFITRADERPPALEPWVQWVTVHTGVPYAEHGIFSLSEGHKLRYRSVWDFVSEKGLPVWVCGSMNVKYEKPLHGYVLPDPWSTDSAPCPDTLHKYCRFVQLNVQEHTNDRVPLKKADYLRFLQFMATHGLSTSTLRATVQQLLSDRKGKTRWKRAFILDKLQFDLFSAVYRSLQPALSTFFLNSTAHMQHMYWRHMEPDLFQAKPSAQEQEEYASAILYGYQEMDRLLARMLKLVGEATVIFATALSQEPCLVYEEKGGKHFYRPHDFEDLLRFAEVGAPHQVAPVMSEQFWIHFQSKRDADEAQHKLTELRAGDRPLMELRPDGSSLFASCCINDPLEKGTVIQQRSSGKTAPFHGIFYEVEGVKSGMHHPDGLLWIRHAGMPAARHSENVRLTDIAPTILDMLTVGQPPFMKGTSLLSEGVAARLG
jgi:hypothetical protein